MTRRPTLTGYPFTLQLGGTVRRPRPPRQVVVEPTSDADAFRYTIETRNECIEVYLLAFGVEHVMAVLIESVEGFFVYTVGLAPRRFS